MVNYQKGKIYQIINSKTPDIYVGSTARNTLAERMSEHRNIAKNKLYNERIVYISMRAIGIEHFNIILLEDYPSENKDQLRMKEQEWIQKLNPILNDRRAFRSEEEKMKYQLDYNKIYFNTPEIKVHRQTYQKAYDKIYREKNIDRIRKIKSEPILCKVCSVTTTRNHIKRHESSQLHQNNLLKQSSKDEVEIVYDSETETETEPQEVEIIFESESEMESENLYIFFF